MTARFLDLIKCYFSAFLVGLGASEVLEGLAGRLLLPAATAVGLFTPVALLPLSAGIGFDDAFVGLGFCSCCENAINPRLINNNVKNLCFILFILKFYCCYSSAKLTGIAGWRTENFCLRSRSSCGSNLPLQSKCMRGSGCYGYKLRKRDAEYISLITQIIISHCQIRCTTYCCTIQQKSCTYEL
jgi:hypothetical protein